MEKKENTKQAFCNHCKKYTEHKAINAKYNNGTGGSLSCVKCSSSRLDTIQGFNASLM